MCTQNTFVSFDNVVLSIPEERLKCIEILTIFIHIYTLRKRLVNKVRRTILVFFFKYEIQNSLTSLFWIFYVYNYLFLFRRSLVNKTRVCIHITAKKKKNQYFISIGHHPQIRGIRLYAFVGLLITRTKDSFS